MGKQASIEDLLHLLTNPLHLVLKEKKLIQIHIHHMENGERWAWTEGLQTLGQQEISVPVSWPEGDSFDSLLIHFLRFIEQYIKEQPRRILPGQTFQYGWMQLRFVSREHNLSKVVPDP